MDSFLELITNETALREGGKGKKIMSHPQF